MSFQLTQKDYDKLKAELKNLYELDKLNIIAIKDAKDQGDLSENSEYDAAKAEEVKINQRIAELENQLKNAVIIDETVLTTETEIVEAITAGEAATVFVEETTFYATMGGQCGDSGVIKTANGVFVVKDTVKVVGGILFEQNLEDLSESIYNRKEDIEYEIEKLSEC